MPMEFETKLMGKPINLLDRRTVRASMRLSPAKLRVLLRISEYEVRRYFTAVSDEMHRKHGNPWPGGTGKGTLSRRSGAGLRSIKNFKVEGNPEGAKGTLRVSKTMFGHERARTIKAKRAKYLTIPLAAALNANGTPKYVSARQWKNTFVISTKKKKLFIVQKNGRKLTFLYALRKSVRIPARLGLRKSLVSNRSVFRNGMMARIRELRGRRVKG